MESVTLPTATAPEPPSPWSLAFMKAALFAVLSVPVTLAFRWMGLKSREGAVADMVDSAVLPAIVGGILGHAEGSEINKRHHLHRENTALRRALMERPTSVVTTPTVCPCAAEMNLPTPPIFGA